MTVVVKLAASTVSEHLAELRRAGLVVERKEGRWVEYRLAGPAIRGRVLDAIWPSLDEDAESRADAILVKELRRIPVDELCRANLDLRRIERPRLATAVRKAARLRATNGALR